VHVPPRNILNISRFSVIADPQLATLALVQWLLPRREQTAELSAPGHIRWHELFAADWEKAFAFYGELFGWQKANPDSDAMGAYQLFSAGGQTLGGMFTKPPSVPVSFWLYYFNVGNIDAAAKRVKAAGVRSSRARLKCQATTGLSNAATLRVPCSHWWERVSTSLSDISNAPHRAIRPTRGAGDGLW
jgi:predicted enzyme related to lactoylglutathione lyase